MLLSGLSLVERATGHQIPHLLDMTAPAGYQMQPSRLLKQVRDSYIRYNYPTLTSHVCLSLGTWFQTYFETLVSKANPSL